MVNPLDLILILIYFIIVIIIGIWAKRGETQEGYLIGERKVGTLLLTGTIVASLFGANSMVTYSAFVYQYGISAIWAYIGTSAGLLILIFLSKKLKEIADKNKFYTFADYFYDKYGNKIGALIGFLIFFYYVGFLVIQFIAGGSILSILTGWSYNLSILIMGLVVIFYVVLGGFQAVIKTDLFQYFLIIFLLLIVSLVMFGKSKVINPSDLNILGSNIGNSAVFFLYGMITIPIAAELWQRVYAGRNFKVIKHSLIYSSIIFLILGIFMTIIALSVKTNFPDIDPKDTVATGFLNLLPIVISGLALVVFFSAIMSTIDTYIFMLSLNFFKDFISRYNYSKKIVMNVRILSILIGFLGMFFAILFSDLIDVVFFLGATTFAMVPAIWGSFHFKLKRISIFLSIIIGIISAIIVLYIIGNVPYMAAIPFSVAIITLLSSQLLFIKYPEL